MKDLLDRAILCHTDYQIDRFILAANGITPWGVYHQALREIHTRYEAAKVDLEQIKDAGVARFDTLARASKERIRELRRFVAVARYIEANHPEVLQNPEECERDFWLRKACQEMIHGNQSEAYRLISVMDPAYKQKFEALAQSQESLVKFAEEIFILPKLEGAELLALC